MKFTIITKKEQQDVALKVGDNMCLTNKGEDRPFVYIYYQKSRVILSFNANGKPKNKYGKKN